MLFPFLFLFFIFLIKINLCTLQIQIIDLDGEYKDEGMVYTNQRRHLLKTNHENYLMGISGKVESLNLQMPYPVTASRIFLHLH